MTEKISVPNINNVTISGRLTKDSEIRYTNSNASILTFRLASSRRYQGSDGEWKEDTLYINIINWGKDYNEKLKDRLKTGTPVIIEGMLQLNTWEDRNTGEKRSSFQIRAYRIHILVRNTDYEYSRSSSSINETINEIDKEFDEIADNENIGGNDDIPF